ncbi:unnamed protein product [Chrysoparadoxa australica]
MLSLPLLSCLIYSLASPLNALVATLHPCSSSTAQVGTPGFFAKAFSDLGFTSSTDTDYSEQRSPTDTVCSPEERECIPINVEYLLGEMLLDKSSQTGTAWTSELLVGCGFVGLYLSSPRSAAGNAFLPLLRAFYLHALRESEWRFCQAFEMAAVNFNRSEGEFEAQFSAVGVCWPAVPYPRSRWVGEKLCQDLALDELPCFIVVNTMTEQVVSVNGVQQVTEAMTSLAPVESVKRLLQAWGGQLRTVELKPEKPPRPPPPPKLTFARIVKLALRKARAGP